MTVTVSQDEEWIEHPLLMLCVWSSNPATSMNMALATFPWSLKAPQSQAHPWIFELIKLKKSGVFRLVQYLSKHLILHLQSNICPCLASMWREALRCGIEAKFLWRSNELWRPLNSTASISIQFFFIPNMSFQTFSRSSNFAGFFCKAFWQERSIFLSAENIWFKKELTKRNFFYFLNALSWHL